MAIMGVIGVIGAVASYSSASSSRKAAEANAEAQYAWDMENYAIQQGYHSEATAYTSALNSYADSQQAFAYERLAYAQQEYQVALGNNQRLQVFKEQEVLNKKLAGETEFNATTDIANLLQLGAQSTMRDVVGESIRTGAANTRATHREALKAQGDIVAQQSGITGGKSVERRQVEVFMEYNRQVASLKDKTKTQLITANNSKNKIVNDNNLRVGEAYRNLQALMKLEASPMQQLAGPAPVFLGRAPVAPVSPLGAAPVLGASTSGGVASDITAGLSGATAGIQLANSIS